MGKSLIIAGIKVQTAGFGNVNDVNESWLLGVDKSIFDVNLHRSSYIQGVTMRFDSYFNGGVNIFENKTITGIRCNVYGAGNLSFGYHDGVNYTQMTDVLYLNAGYVEKRFQPFTVPPGKYLAIALNGCQLSVCKNPTGFNHIGYSFNDTHSTEFAVLMDFKSVK